MKYTETGIDGVTVVDIEPHNHERWLFARSFCADEFAKNGLDSTVAQVNFAYTPRSAARCADCTGRCRHSAKPNWCDVRAVPSLLWPSTSGGNPLPSVSKRPWS